MKEEEEEEEEEVVVVVVVVAKGREKRRLLVVDDHAMVRSGLRYMLAREPDLQLVGEAGNGHEALELCRHLRPDLVLMDVSMPDMDGLTATRAIKQEYPAISVIMVTVHEDPDYLYKALKAGANGYILKDASKSELMAAIRRALGGGTPLDPELAGRLLREVVSEDDAKERSSGRPKGLDGELTGRELEVLRLLAWGRTNLQIAQELRFSVHTVKAHVRRVISKLGVSDRTGAAVRATELGLIEAGGAPTGGAPTGGAPRS